MGVDDVMDRARRGGGKQPQHPHEVHDLEERPRKRPMAPPV